MGKRTRRSSKAPKPSVREPNAANMLEDLAYEAQLVDSSQAAAARKLELEYERKIKDLEAEYQKKYEDAIEDLIKRAVEKAFLMMLHFPLEALLRYYWSKASKKKLEKFIEHTLDIYKGYMDGSVDIAEIKQHLLEHGGVRITDTISGL